MPHAVSGVVVATTANSAKVRVTSVDGRSAEGTGWFPYSKCEDLDEDAEAGDEVEFDCPAWLLEEKEVDW